MRSVLLCPGELDIRFKKIDCFFNVIIYGAKINLQKSLSFEVITNRSLFEFDCIDFKMFIFAMNLYESF